MHVSKPIIIDVVKHLVIRSSALFCLWVAFTLGNADAAIYACPTANGDVAYQDRPCEKKSDNKTSTPSAESSVNDSEYPLGMHPSWFAAPAHAPQPAYCDRLGCDCASLTRNFRAGLVAAVADALFLEASWHRYAESVIRIESDPPKGFAYLELQAEISDSACEVQMSQITLKNYAGNAVERMKLNASNAELRGNTQFEQCDGTNAQVCADVDAYSLYERVQMDLDTLRTPRSLFVAEAD